MEVGVTGPLGEGVPLLALQLLVEVPHELPEDERVDVLAQLVEEEPVTNAGASADGLNLHHRRRIYSEDKAKVVAAVWGTEFIQFLAKIMNSLKCMSC